MAMPLSRRDLVRQRRAPERPQVDLRHLVGRHGDLAETGDEQRDQREHLQGLLEDATDGTGNAHLVVDELITGLLREQGLYEDFCRIGRRVAEIIIELFADAPPGDPLFEQYSFVSSDALPEYRGLLGSTSDPDPATWRDSDRDAFLELCESVRFVAPGGEAAPPAGATASGPSGPAPANDALVHTAMVSMDDPVVEIRRDRRQQNGVAIEVQTEKE